MKTVLFLSMYFLPNTSVAANRASFTAGYLYKMGWKTIVITTAVDDGSLPEISLSKSILPPEHYIHRIKWTNSNTAYWTALLRKFKWHLLSQSEFFGGYDLLWQNLLPKAEEIAYKYCPDIIFCTSPPPIMAHIGHYLGSKHDIPYVVDMRDVPQQYVKLAGWIDRRKHKLDCTRMSKPVADASAVLTVSEGLSNILYDYYRCKTYVILNGYDHMTHDFANSRKQESNKFTITYTGSLSQLGLRARSPEPLFGAIDILIEKYGQHKLPWQIRLIGVLRHELLKFKKYKSFNMCEFMKRVSYEESLVFQHSSTVLLHLTHRGTKGMMTSKIFDYLATSLPILTIPGDNDCVDELLRKVNAGVSLSNPEDIAEKLMAWFAEWRRNGHISLDVDKKEIEKYSRENQTKRLAAILEDIG